MMKKQQRLNPDRTASLADVLEWYANDMKKRLIRKLKKGHVCHCSQCKAPLTRETACVAVMFCVPDHETVHIMAIDHRCAERINETHAVMLPVGPEADPAVAIH